RHGQRPATSASSVAINASTAGPVAGAPRGSTAETCTPSGASVTRTRKLFPWYCRSKAPSSSARLVISTPSMRERVASTAAKTSLRSACTTKPVTAWRDCCAAATVPEAVTVPTPPSSPRPSTGTISGGTSSGRSSGAIAYSSLERRNHPQPEVATRVPTTRPAIARRGSETMECMGVSGSARRIGAGAFHMVTGRGHPLGLVLVLCRQRQQRTPQPVADALALQERLDRHRVGLDAHESDDRQQLRLECPRLLHPSRTRQVAQPAECTRHHVGRHRDHAVRAGQHCGAGGRVVAAEDAATLGTQCDQCRHPPRPGDRFLDTDDAREAAQR